MQIHFHIAHIYQECQYLWRALYIQSTAEMNKNNEITGLY